MPQSRGSQGPRLFCAVRAAALATLTSQLFNLAMIVLGFVVCAKRDGERPSFSLRFRSLRIPNYLAMLLPILASEFLWSLGQNVESAVYGHIGTASLAAYTLTCPIQGLGAALISALLLLLAGAYTDSYRVDREVKAIGKALLIVFALYAPVKVENMILGGGIIRSGGRTGTIMLIDTVGTWCLGKL